MGVIANPRTDAAMSTEMADAGSRPRDKISAGAPGWNVVVTLPEATAPQARRVMRPWGRLFRTDYFHVLVMSVDDPDRFLCEFGEEVDATPGILNFIAHVFPAQRTFDFATVPEFEQKAREAVMSWAPILAGSRFHVRLHRRGMKGVLSTPKEERFLDDALLQAASTGGTPGRIGFDAADYVIHIETVDHRAGLSLWRREDLDRYPFLGTS